MRFRIYTILAALAASFSLAPLSARAQGGESFDSWVAGFKQDAQQQGISLPLLNEAFSDVSPIDRIIELDRKQPESTLTMDEYLDKVVPQSRIDRARDELESNRQLLDKVSREYGVPPQYIVALWGIESNFGERQGTFEIVEALATLAYDGRRSEYFRKELINAFKILEGGHIPLHEMTGSWAGAMGQCQFMPTSFLRYAVDYDGDGRKDIWGTEPDVFASIANYLSSEGWDTSAGYGNADNPGHNFKVILKWNRSRYFASAVGLLARKIAEGA